MLQCCSSLLPIPYSLFPVPYSLLCVTASWEHYAAMLLPAPTHSRECAKRDEKPPNWLAVLRTKSLPSDRKEERILQK